ncbi:potassium-transporting ATPase subunit F [Fulvivirgaceae bacterium PWU20]|uniref:Potassium-transporting ATPase subunit F n=1 Tax=Chryseosolibacter indicus TaxID=2782351 RepID=A0ABS5VYI9_9BACT|nr:potassium-transporting ATPase subunit F [Chryseosolibacter indicus]
MTTSKKYSAMMLILFCLSVAVCCYLLYVLLKPEKF